MAVGTERPVDADARALGWDTEPWSPPVKRSRDAQDVRMKFIAAQMLPGVLAHWSYQKHAEESILKKVTLSAHPHTGKYF